MENENLPTHIAIIMDGNRRWAKKRNLPVSLGHKAGAETLEKIVRYANKIWNKVYNSICIFNRKLEKSTRRSISINDIISKLFR